MANAKYKVKGNDKIKGYDSELEIEVDDKYEAFSKDIPAPMKYQGMTITWFNNFGVREKSNGKEANITYTVKLKKLPEGKRLFTFHDNEVHEIEPKYLSKDRVKFTLSVGDPPTGMAP